MDSNIINEINLLQANRKKIDSSSVYDLMIHSIKGKYLCEEQRKKFVLNRSFGGTQKIYDPTYVEPYAADFINCFATMTKTTKEKCQNQYKNIYECLATNHGKNYNFPEKCVGQMEDFINC
jgi:hypothetical protein